MKKSRLLIASSVLLATCACTSLKANTFAEDDIAIRGYDAVAYHTASKPIRGNPRYSLEYNGVLWHFSSDENLAKFRANAERYAPQYGGYCAYAMSKGYVVSTDPNAWKVVDEKLYLNYSLGVRKTWLKDVPGYIASADENWLNKASQSISQ